jgi:hypothetical protein
VSCFQFVQNTSSKDCMFLCMYCQWHWRHPGAAWEDTANTFTQCFFSKKMFSGTLSLTQENHHFIVQIRKNKCSQCTKLPRTCITSYYIAHSNSSGNSNILKFLLSPVRFTKRLAVRIPLQPPEKKHCIYPRVPQWRHTWVIS